MELGAITYKTKLAELLKTEPVRDIVSNMFKDIDTKINPAREAIETNMQGGRGLSTSQVIEDETIITDTAQKRLVEYNEFLLKLYELSQNTVKVSIEREKTEINRLVEEIEKRIRYLVEQIRGCELTIRSCNEILASAGPQDDVTNVLNTKSEAEQMKAEFEMEKSEIEIELAKCAERLGCIDDIHIDSEIELLTSKTLSSADNPSRDSRVVSYANSLAEAMGRGDKDEIDSITEDMYNELGIDQKGLEKELGRLYNQSNRDGDSFYADELRALAHSIQTGEGIERLADNTISETVAESSIGSTSPVVPTTHEEMVEAMNNREKLIRIPQGSRLVFDGSGLDNATIDARDGDRYLVLQEHVPSDISTSGVLYYEADKDGNVSFANGTNTIDPVVFAEGVGGLNEGHGYIYNNSMYYPGTNIDTATVAGETPTPAITTPQYTENATVGFASEQYTEGPIQSDPASTAPVVETQPEVATAGNSANAGGPSIDRPY